MMKIHTDLIRMRVKVHGKNVQEYTQGQNVFVMGQRGSNFSLLIENLTAERILVHPSIDGLSVMNGKPAVKDDSSDGYVISPHQELEIKGWRLDDENVAEFKFGDRERAYSEQTGEGGDQGVIACAVWQEKTLPILKVTHHCRPDPGFRSMVYGSSAGGVLRGSRTVGSCSKSASEPRATVSINSCHVSSEAHATLDDLSGVFLDMDGADDASPDITEDMADKVNNLGTEFGAQARDNVQRTHFTCATKSPVGIAVIYYDDKKGLAKRGINVDKKKKRTAALPQPYRGSGCKPPDGWPG